MNHLGRLAAALALAASLVPAGAFAWPHATQGMLVQSYSYNSHVAPDANGGSYVAYMAYNFATSSYDAYLQHFDADGVALFGVNGLLLCGAVDNQQPEVALADNEGGVYVVWQDYRAGGYAQADYYAQRVNSSGFALWTAGGVPVVTATGQQVGLRAVVSTTGLNCVWQDLRNSGVSGSDVYETTLYYWNGQPSNAVQGNAVCTATGEQTYPDLAIDDSGYLTIAWQDQRTGAADVYAQRMNSGGSAAWAANGVAVCTAVGQQLEPRVAAFNSNRVVVSWTDLRGADSDVYAQALDSYAGSNLWTANGIPVCNTSGTQYLADMQRDINGGATLLWTDGRRGSAFTDLYAQRLDPSGAAQWTTNGTAVRIANGTATPSRMLMDRTGGAYVVWQDNRSDLSDVYAQRLSVNGYALWNSAGVPIGQGTSSQASPSLASSPSGGVFVAYDDYGGNPYGTRLNYLDEWGYLGANPIMASVKDVPNDQGGQVKVSWYGSPLDTDPLYRNISDYVVYRSVPTRLVAQLARAGVATKGVAGAPDAVTLDGKRYVRVPSAAQDYFWEELAHVTPRHLAQYSYVAATEGDSIAGSNPRTAFMVMAVANYGSAWWVTKADSGYSVDNLAPVAPAPLTGQYGAGTTALHWMPNAEADLAGYRIYRGSSASFTPSLANRVAAVADTGYADVAAAPYFYKVTAVDTHGNESPVATLMPSGTLAVEGGAARAMFAAPAPNPLRGGAASTLRFALAAGGRTKLALYDAQGRVARVLVDGALEAGEHAVTLKGAGLAPGLYLARLESPGFTAARRVMVVE